jgi:phosphonopyruvate decarboxylase
MTRLDATRVVVAVADAATPIIASLGHPAYDLCAVEDRPANFYTWGSMGLASSIGLGLAMAKPDRPVVVLDGDGSLLMNLGSLATIGWRKPANLVVVVWDNESYATTGGQDTATKHGADLAAAATALRVPNAVTVQDPSGLADAMRQALAGKGPWVVVAKVSESAPTLKPPLDGVFIKQRFMYAMGNPEPATSGQPS